MLENSQIRTILTKVENRTDYLPRSQTVGGERLSSHTIQSSKHANHRLI